MDNNISVQERSFRDNNSEAIRHFSVCKDKVPSTFRLLRVQGLPAWANTSSVSIGDVIRVIYVNIPCIVQYVNAFKTLVPLGSTIS